MGQGLALSWDDGGNAPGVWYRPWASIAGLSYVQLGATTNLLWPVSPPQDQVAIYYVDAWNGTNASGPSNRVTNAPTVVVQPPPGQPSNLNATAISRSQVTVSWTDNSGGSAETIVERSTSTSSGFYQVARVAVGVSRWTDGGLSKNKLYCYRVRAVNGWGMSPYQGPSCDRTFRH